MYKKAQRILIIAISLMVFSCKPSTQKELSVNPDHRFEISPCEFKYNGQVFSLGGDIQELIDIFGPYDRYYHHGYAWDSVGIGVLCHHLTGKTVEMKICFDCCEWIKQGDKESVLPYNCFQGAILVDGVPFGNGKSMEDFKQQLYKKGSEIEFSYWKLMKDYNYEYDCDYDEVPSKHFSDMNHVIFIRPNTSTSYSTFTLTDSREHHRLDREAKKNQQAE